MKKKNTHNYILFGYILKQWMFQRRYIDFDSLNKRKSFPFLELIETENRAFHVRDWIDKKAVENPFSWVYFYIQITLAMANVAVSITFYFIHSTSSKQMIPTHSNVTVFLSVPINTISL